MNTTYLALISIASLLATDSFAGPRVRPPPTQPPTGADTARVLEPGYQETLAFLRNNSLSFSNGKGGLVVDAQSGSRAETSSSMLHRVGGIAERRPGGWVYCAVWRDCSNGTRISLAVFANYNCSYNDSHGDGKPVPPPIPEQ